MRIVLAALAVLGPASVLAQTANLPEARAVPQTQAPLMPGVPQTKVKTQRIDADGRAVPTVPEPTTPAPPSPGAMPVPPTVRVPVYRVDPNGTMHKPVAGDGPGR